MTFKKPSEEEQEFFARQEAETKRRLAFERAQQIAHAERDRLQKLHFMHCPKCGMALEEVLFRGVKIDKCFHCNGAWFDAEELEQMASHKHDFVRALVNIYRHDK